MPKLYDLQTDFVGGIMDRRVLMRSDVEGVYPNAAAVLDNWFVHAQGGISRRPGTRFECEIETPETPVRLEAFEFDEGEVYMFVFCTDGLYIYGDPNNTGRFEHVQTHTAALADGAGTIRQQVVTQTGDVMYICRNNRQPREIRRTSNTTFTNNAFNVANLPSQSGQEKGVAAPFYKFAPTEAVATLVLDNPPDWTQEDPQEVAPGEEGTITIDQNFWIDPDHDGAIISFGSLLHSDGDVQFPQIKIISITNQTTARFKLLTSYLAETKRKDDPILNLDGTLTWFEEAWSDLRGWPRVVEFHAGRLWLASTPLLPNWMWGSRIGVYDFFHPQEGNDDDAVSAPIESDKISRIRYMTSARDLQVYTDQAEFFVESTINEPITPRNFSIRRVSNYGTAFARPVLFDGATIFLQKNRNLLRELLWTELNQGYTANPISLMVETLLNKPWRMAGWHAGKDTQEQLLFCPDQDGDMMVYFASRQQKITGWVRWLLEDALVIDIDVTGSLPYLAVQRTIDGSTKYYLERISVADNLLLDSALALEAVSPQSVWTGLDHLEGEEVEVTASVQEDGQWRDNAYYLGKYTVSSGQIDISDPNDYAFERIIVGKAFTATMRTMPAEVGTQSGSLTSRPKRVNAVTLHLDQSMSIQLQGQQFYARQVFDDMSLPPPLVTGPKRFYLLGVSLRKQFELVSELPLPCNLLALTQEIVY